MKNPITRAVLVLFSLNLFVATIAVQAAQERFGRYEVRRSSSTQPVGEDQVLSLAATVWGGVVLQARGAFVGRDGSIIDSQRVELVRFDSEAGRLYLSHGKLKTYVLVEGDTLARIISWIDNGGTGLYTAHDMPDPKLAGVSLYRHDLIATEFLASKVAPLASYIDFHSPFLLTAPPNEEEILKRVNEGLSLDDAVRPRDYVVSDLDADFKFYMDSDELKMTGTLYVYHRIELKDKQRVFVSDVQAFIDDVAQVGQKSEGLISTRHISALQFVRTVALLRTISSSNPETWKRFSESFFELASK